MSKGRLITSHRHTSISSHITIAQSTHSSQLETELRPLFSTTVIMKLFIIAAAVVLFIGCTIDTTIAESDALANNVVREKLLHPNFISAVQSVESDGVQELDGRIIYLENADYLGYWLNYEGPYDFSGHQTNLQRLRQLSKYELVNWPGYKWKVYYIGGENGAVALENQSIKYGYMSHLTLNVHADFWQLPPVYVIKSAPNPEYDTDVQLYLTDMTFDSNGTPTSMKIRHNSPTGGAMGIAHYEKPKYTTGTVNHNIWNVYIPPAYDEFAVIYTLDNRQNSQLATFERSVSVGFSKTNGQSISKSLEVSLQVELSGTFKGVSGKATAGIKYSQTWQQQTSETWSISTTTKITTTVAAGDLLEVRQLTGYYGEGDGQIATRAKFVRFVNPDSGEEVDQPLELERAATADAGMEKHSFGTGKYY